MSHGASSELHGAPVWAGALRGLLVSVIGGVALLQSPPLRAAAHIEATFIDTRAGSASTTFDIWMQDGLVHVQGQSGHITLLNNGILYYVDPDTKSYEAIDRSVLQMLSPNTDRLRQQLQARAAYLPPAQRAVAEQYMDRVAPTPSADTDADRARDTGRTELYDSQPYELWECRHNGALITQFLVAPAAAVAGADDWIQAVHQLDQLTAGIKTPQRGGDEQRFFGRAQDLVRMPGVPVVMREFNAGGQLRSEWRLRLSASAPRPADWFKVPSDYQASLNHATALWLTRTD